MDFDTEQETIQTGDSMKGSTIQMISLNDIKLSRNSRREIKDEDLSGLMQSIKEVGLLQPIGVSKDEKGGYTINYGNRRYLACSKLGISPIPVVIQKNKSAADEDLKNLTENIQRRNISLIEAGRYVSILQDQGLGQKEIATRLGVPASYVKDTLDAFNLVPQKFKKDIETSVAKTKNARLTPGKISVGSATAIITAKRVYKLNDRQEEYLYRQAKKNDKFDLKSIKNYAAKLKAGDPDPVGSQQERKHVGFQLSISVEEYERLQEKYIVTGKYQGMAGIAKAILKGQLAERFNTVGD